ncbi:MAG: cellulase family glycosylhydrolase [Ginsengibacter sp.]
MDRRSFIQNTGLLTAAVGLTGSSALASAPGITNKLPKWKGFNFVDFNTANPDSNRRYTTEDQLKWMQDWGFNFVRLPIAYPYYLKFDRSKNITPEEVYQIDEEKVDRIDQLVQLANKHQMHVSLNLHRAPGYCVNAGFHEPYNLWKDQAALDAFCFHWNMWAKRYKNTSKDKISFDLVNEPSLPDNMDDQHTEKRTVPGDLYRKVAKAALEAIKKENKERLVVADGNNKGTTVIDEITDLDIAQSCRGYFPHSISHYKASWANKDPEHMPVPVYPGQNADGYISREKLEEYYKPWIDLVKKGVGVHCGECGCYTKTPHDVFLAWLNDVLDILTTNKIGFALWEFVGDFGVLNSNRADVAYEDWYGFKLDRKLLTLIQKY